MVVRHPTRPGAGQMVEPVEFTDAVRAVRAARLRPEVHGEDMPAPQRIAPHATAMSGDVTIDDEDIATGRIILLHDPTGNDAWQGTFRFVTYARADIDPELSNDPLLGEVGWSWLEEALEHHGAAFAEPSGTVTRVITESFGGMVEEPGSAQIEIRASWTPSPGPDGTVDFTAHVEAWGELLCTCAGLEPLPEGVAAMPSRRGQRGPA